MIKPNYIKREAMDLLTHYQNELIGLLVVALLLIIFFIIKGKKKTLAPLQELVQKETIEPSSPEPSQDNEQEQKNPDSVPSKTEAFQSMPELEGKEEGDFQEQLKEEALTPQTPVKKAYKKRDVPPHQKITKDDFKEFHGLRILIAEDNLINQKVLQGLLADSGIEIVMANDGIEALETLEHDDNFSLILMDAHMPRLDGFETTKRIRMNPAYNHIAVIALSGDTAADDIKKMKEAGMVEHIEKPLKMDALYDILYAYSTTDENDTLNCSLDIEEGLYICGEDELFYKDILQEFLTNYQDSADVLQTLIESKNLQEADRLLLDIIGVAANIGATKLTEIAQALKTSLSNEAQTTKLLQSYNTELTSLIHTITTYLQDK